MLKEEVIVELKKIGFSPCELSEKEKQDGKGSFVWTYPVKGSNQWFSIKLLEDKGQYFVEVCSDINTKNYVSVNIADFIKFIKSELINN